jgi:hypothetical protein
MERRSSLQKTGDRLARAWVKWRHRGGAHSGLSSGSAGGRESGNHATPRPNFLDPGAIVSGLAAHRFFDGRVDEYPLYQWPRIMPKWPCVHILGSTSLPSPATTMVADISSRSTRLSSRGGIGESRRSASRPGRTIASPESWDRLNGQGRHCGLLTSGRVLHVLLFCLLSPDKARQTYFDPDIFVMLLYKLIRLSLTLPRGRATVPAPRPGPPVRPGLPFG